jgi:hypothetical protein
MEHEFDPRDLEPSLPSEDEPRKRRWGPIVIAVGALLGFGGLLWYSYTLGHREQASNVAPLIKADAGPTKVKPDDPGGLEVPNQDKLVLNNIAGGGDGPKGNVERLLPAAETPLPPPVATQAPANGNVPPPIAPPPPKQAVTTPLPPPTQTPPPPVDKSQPPAPAAAPRTAVGAQPLPGSVAAPATSTAAPVTPAPGAPTQIAALPSATPKPTKPAPAAPTPAAPAASGPQGAIPTPATPAPVAAAAPAPAVPKPAKAAGPGGYRVQLAAVRSQDAAAAEWAKLQKANPELGSLQLNVVQVELPDKGTFYRVQAGPLSDQGSADQLCGALKARSQGCIVVHP